jgi:predicted phosphodiesterase
MIFFGDWASGIPRARLIAEQMRKYIDGREAPVQHVVHLGDTYYSGWPNEFEKRFLDCWPVAANEADNIGSWSVNGNHDMYSGGEGFFKTLLSDPRFAGHEDSSLFKLENRHWRILGLDTAYKDHDLESPQDEWITEEAHKAREQGQKFMLLSHHQLFSTYESDGEALKAKLAPLLEKGLIHTWFWGHEHRCVVYEPHQGVKYARCIGHAGVPVYVTTKSPEPGKAPYAYHYTEDKIERGFEKYAVFGFCVLDFDGPTIAVRYLNEFGNEHYRETIS